MDGHGDVIAVSAESTGEGTCAPAPPDAILRAGLVLAVTALAGLGLMLAWALLASRIPGVGAVQSLWGATALAMLGAAAVCAATVDLMRRLRGARHVLDALSACRAGVDDLEALRVEPGLHTAADGLNALIDRGRARRAEELDARAATLLARRSSAAGDLGQAVGALWQGVLLVDDEFRVRHANPAAAILLDAEVQAGITTVDDLFEDEAVRAAARATVTARGGARHQVLVRRSDAQGDPLVLRVGLRPAARGDEGGAVILVEDATQQVRADEARTEFVTQATHELRGPLANIRLYAETAMEDGDDDPALRGRCLGVISNETRRLDRLVADMLSVAEIEAGAISLHVDDVRTDRMLDEMVRDYEAQARERKIELRFNPATKMPVLQGDCDKIAVVLHNVIGNALKYTAEGGTVDINVDVDESTFAVEVLDTGFGIAADELERIFDRFHRVSDDDRVAAIVGTGLGLSLARDIARLHGGDITVESEPDVGSRFRFTLPLVARRAEAA